MFVIKLSFELSKFVKSLFKDFKNDLEDSINEIIALKLALNRVYQ